MFKRKYIGPALILILVVMQFFRIDKTNPPVDMNQDFISIMNPPKEIAVNLKAACYDCHAHTTKYPWYANIAPVSWWIKGHINNGRKHLNFSSWGTYSEDKRMHKIEENIEFLENAWMPLKSYTWLHSDAKLSDEERKAMVDYFKNLLQ